MRAWVTQSRATLVAAGGDAHGTWLPRSRRVTLHPSFLARADVTRHQRQEGPQCVCNRRVLPGPRHRCCGPTDCPPRIASPDFSPGPPEQHGGSLRDLQAPPFLPVPAASPAPSTSSRPGHDASTSSAPHPIKLFITAAPRHTHAMLSLDCFHSLIRSLRMRCSSPTFTPASR